MIQPQTYMVSLSPLLSRNCSKIEIEREIFDGGRNTSESSECGVLVVCVNLSETLKMRERVSLYSIKRNDYVISTYKRTTSIASINLHVPLLFHSIIILETANAGKLQQARKIKAMHLHSFFSLYLYQSVLEPGTFSLIMSCILDIKYSTS